MQEMSVQSLGQKDPLEKEMATCSSILTWEVPWTEELCKLQSIESDTAQLTNAGTFHSSSPPTKIPVKDLNPTVHYFNYQSHQTILQRCRFNPWVEKSRWRRTWQPIPVFLLGKVHGQRNLVFYSPWDHKESDMTKETTHAPTYV